MNGSPVMATATREIAMGGAGTDAAIETADVTQLNDDLGKLPKPFGDVPKLGRAGPAQLAALIGVAPFAHGSGRLHRARHVRGGRAAVRHVLSVVALAATRYNPELGAFCPRLVAAGKPRMKDNRFVNLVVAPGWKQFMP